MSLIELLSYNELVGLERAFAVIVVSEIGDKTFLIAAILAMRHPRLIIFTGAFMALALMSLLSALLGHIVPHLLPKRYTTIAAAVLFVAFGAKMLKEGIDMEGGTGHIEEEMQQVQKEVEEVEQTPDVELGLQTPQLNGRPLSRPVSPSIAGKRRLSEPKSPLVESSGPFKRASEGLRNLAHLLFSPILVQSFVLTFLAEWGDRSQITTIALGAAHNVWIVTIGTIAGHSVCTLGAVLGGRWLATKISVKKVTLGGAVLFLIFGCVYAYEALYMVDEEP